MMMRFDGKTALVTGGTSGIGRATALAFARDGASVAIVGRRETEGAETVGLIEKAGSRGLFIACDVTDETGVTAAVDLLVETFGGLHYAVNAAGVEADGRPLIDGDQALFDRIMIVNAKGVWLAMQAEIRAMLSTGGGAIVNIASVGGLVGFPHAAIYSASKHAVVGLTRAGALEYASQGIRINAVAPGTVETPMFDTFAGSNSDIRAQITKMHPIGRIADAAEIADAAVWLCSEGASFVTGQVLAVDGGFTAQ